MFSENAFFSVLWFCQWSLNASRVCCRQDNLRQDAGLLQHDAAVFFLQIASLPKENGARGRTVVITQGALPTVVASQGKVSSCSYDEFNLAFSTCILDLYLKGLLCCYMAATQQ